MRSLGRLAAVGGAAGEDRWLPLAGAHEQTILAALGDSEKALVAYGEEHTRRQRLVEAAASQVALTLSRDLYLSGPQP